MITMWNKNGVRYLELDDQNVIIVIKLMRCYDSSYVTWISSNVGKRDYSLIWK